MSSIQDSLSTEEKLSIDQQVSQASERWPRKPWWLITRSSTSWNDLLRSDVSRLITATPISRPLTSDELDALGEVASAVESARSESRYSATATYATAVWFYTTRRGLPVAFSRQSSLYKAIFPTMIVWVLSGVALNTSARLTINSPRLQQFKRDIKAHAVASRGQQPMSGPGPMAPRPTPQQQPLEQGIMTPSSTAQPETKLGLDDSWLLAYERSRLKLERDIDYYTQSLQKLDQRLPEDGKSPGFMAGLGRKMAVATLEGKVRQYNELIVKENMRRAALGLPNIAGRHYPMPSEAAQRGGAFGADATEQGGGSEDSFASEQQWDAQANRAEESAQRWDAQPSTTHRGSQFGAQARASPPAPPQDDWDPIDEIEADDASPVAPSARRRPRPTPSEGSAGSAWAKLRQRALSGEQESAPGPYDQQQSRLRPEKFSYDQAEEEKALAKDQAQKEFDAMLERERRGESDDESRGGRGRWS